MSAGRPVKYTAKAVHKIKADFLQYIENTDIPIVAEFAYLHKIPRQKLYEIEELNDTVKECIDKKEAALERQALDGAINTTMAIFSLKQLGWRDKHDVEHTGGITVVFDDALKDV